MHRVQWCCPKGLKEHKGYPKKCLLSLDDATSTEFVSEDDEDSFEIMIISYIAFHIISY